MVNQDSQVCLDNEAEGYQALLGLLVPWVRSDCLEGQVIVVVLRYRVPVGRRGQWEDQERPDRTDRGVRPEYEERLAEMATTALVLLVGIHIDENVACPFTERRVLRHQKQRLSMKLDTS